MRVGLQSFLCRHRQAKPARRGLAEHPVQGDVRQTPIVVPAAHVRVDAGEPYLFDGLSRDCPRLVPGTRQEVLAPFIDGQGVVSEADIGIQGRVMEPFPRVHDQRFDRVPDADEVNRTRAPERLEEIRGHGRVVLGVVYLRRVLDQVVMARAQQSALEEHPGQRTRCEGAATESEQVDAISLLVVVGEVAIGVLHVLLQAVPGGLVAHRAQFPALLVILPAACADAGIVVGDLILVLLEHEVSLDDVRVVAAEFVAGAVAADGDVLHGCPQVPPGAGGRRIT